VIITDIRTESIERVRQEIPGIHVMQPEHIFSVEANVFAPCALGAQLNKDTIPQMQFDIIAGAANNQIATKQDEVLIAEKNILYVPDYVINAGGVIAVAYEYFDRIGQNPFAEALTRESMMRHVDMIGPTIEHIISIAQSEKISTARAADRMAETLFMGDDAQRRTGGV